MKATDRGSFAVVQLPQPQTTVARCYSVVHIGTVPTIINGVQKGSADKVHITWEMPELLAVFDEDKGPQPFVVGIELTLSTNDNSNLSKLVSQWRGRPFTQQEKAGFDPSIFIGRKCLLQFIHRTKKKYIGQQITEATNENTSLVFNAIMQLPKSMVCPDQINESYVFDWEPMEKGEAQFDQAHFEKMPKWLQDKVKTSEEFKKYAARFYRDSGTQDAQYNPLITGQATQQAPQAATEAKPPQPAPPVAEGDEW